MLFEVFIQVQTAVRQQHHRKCHEVVAYENVAGHILHDIVVDLDACHAGAIQSWNHKEVLDVSSGGEKDDKIFWRNVVLKAIARFSLLQALQPVSGEFLRFRRVHGSPFVHPVHRLPSQQPTQQSGLRDALKALCVGG